MSKLPVISGKHLIKILCKYFNFRPLRQKGSHVTLTNDFVFITVPMHNELDKGTLLGILKGADISKEDFIKNL